MADARLVIAQTAFNRAITQFTGYDFNSFARIAGAWYGFNETGMFPLGGSTDGDAAISAYFEIYHDFGQVIRLRSLVFGVEASGPLSLILTWDDNAVTQHTLPMSDTGNRSHRVKVFTQAHADRGQYMRLRVGNVDGADFSIDEIVANVVPLGNRRVR